MLNTTIPLSSIDTYTTGFAKPFVYLVIGVVCLGLTLLKWMVFGNYTIGFTLLIAVAAFIRYFLEKSLILNFSTTGGNGICFLFKRSVIEGVNVDESFAERVGEIVKRNYILQTRK